MILYISDPKKIQKQIDELKDYEMLRLIGR